MKRTSATLVMAIIISISACKKNDYCDKTPKHQATCDLMQVLESSGDKDGSVSRYRKEYDPSTGKVSKVVVGLFTFCLGDSISLIPKYDGNDIHFVREDNENDTVITATFDGNNRLLKLTQGNAPHFQLASMLFSYSSNRLLKLHFAFSSDFTFDLVPTYDANGNVTKLIDPTGTGQSYFYTYDLSVRATQQFYSDDFEGDGYNSMYMAEFMGWLPDLEPVNKRTHVRLVTGDYEIADADLADHIYDASGKLLSYQSGATFTNIWNCTTSRHSCSH